MSGLLITAVVATIVAWLAYNQRPKPGAAWLAAMLVAVAWWAAFYALELPIQTMATRRPFMKLQWLASLTIPVFWFCFALEYTGRDRYVTRWSTAALLVVPAVVFGFVATFEHHGLIYQDPQLVERGGTYVVDHVFGPLFYLGIGYAYLVILGGSLLFISLVFDRSPTHRRQSGALLAAVIAPWVGNLVHVLHVPMVALDPTPIAFLVTGVASYVALNELDLFDAVPVPDSIARDVVVEGMEDPVVVVDERNRVVDANAAASTIFGYDADAALGRDAARAIPGYPQAGDGDQDTVEVETGRGRRYFDVTVSDITNSSDRRIGRVVTMRDVTERTHDEQRLDVLNRVLRHNLRNEMNIVAASAEQLSTTVDDEELELVETIRERANDVAALGDTARRIERLLESADEEAYEPLGTMLDRVLERGRSQFPTASFEAVWTTEEGTVYCPRTVQPILWSLLENGAAEDDAVVTVFVTPGTDGYVSVTVADDGPVIPKRQREVLKSGTETPLDHTSGLGLWLAVWGIRSIGGTIDFESEAETGNAITLHVPCEIETSAAAESQVVN
ncbi:histidine kinase N-terminal 7TM domain-containing protein [Haloarchaeobius salinus]|uniref:histidine kinase N-terminal 7TM domain-containing protein n=1 Tax=Haloarchaeobius salinus TaxID=1198298 RepID=UPI00210A9369|nr:histidine kinase N-terminal 7TM domain-containing protein [Haloarchaeobius salinus]